MTERQHIYEDLNESSSASPGGSQQLEIPPSPNSKRAANFFQIRGYFTRTEISTPTKILSYAYISARRQHFVYPPIFWEAPIFCVSANILEGANILHVRQYFGRHQYFVYPPIFWKAPIFCISANILEGANIFLTRLFF